MIAGLGDSGLLTAINLAKHKKRLQIVGISAKAGLVSGQELGLRLSQPQEWARDHQVAFERYKRLDGSRTVHGNLRGLDLEAKTVSVQLADGTQTSEPYDILVLSTGVTNGFWRRPHLQSAAEVSAELQEHHHQLESASSVAVVGGGAAAVSSALNLATRWPQKRVDLYFPNDRGLLGHHAKSWLHAKRRLEAAGVYLHPEHRAVVPQGFAFDAITSEPIDFSTGQSSAQADAVIWAIGRVTPNTGWLPRELLDADGFVRTTETLQLPGHADIFAIGDVAATDPLRSSARARADGLLAANIVARLDGKPLKRFKAPQARWGSVFGVQPDGLQVYAPNGKVVRIPIWFVKYVQTPLIVDRGIYKGLRRAVAGD